MFPFDDVIMITMGIEDCANRVMYRVECTSGADAAP